MGISIMHLFFINVYRRLYVIKSRFKLNVSKFDQEIPQSPSAEQPTAPCGRAT